MSAGFPLTRPSDKSEGHPLPQGERVERAATVAAARSWIGTPYRHQASLKGVGCDCLGLFVGVWREVTGETVGPLPAYTPDWAEANGRETLAEGLAKYLTPIDPNEAREGDVVLFRWRVHLPAKHCGILVAPDRMVHAQERAAVSEVALSDWWRRRMTYRLFASALSASAVFRHITVHQKASLGLSKFLGPKERVPLGVFNDHCFDCEVKAPPFVEMGVAVRRLR